MRRMSPYLYTAGRFAGRSLLSAACLRLPVSSPSFLTLALVWVPLVLPCALWCFFFSDGCVVGTANASRIAAFTSEEANPNSFGPAVVVPWPSERSIFRQTSLGEMRDCCERGDPPPTAVTQKTGPPSRPCTISLENFCPLWVTSETKSTGYMRWGATKEVLGTCEPRHVTRVSPLRMVTSFLARRGSEGEGPSSCDSILFFQAPGAAASVPLSLRFSVSVSRVFFPLDSLLLLSFLLSFFTSFLPLCLLPSSPS
mmetsp:Transcript_11918/g.28047  ORF Transcript_11918/g.28047 Transcript_11918/m.28047 type:complete len:255 (+) Transcript_11918:59-823(+)